mmetsp:Transcript_8170/g.20575  ORF Transcript_8170/g.20575 Transcript_8170/m.20575 type:complete len:217 (-) Transcript_8170:180-830(-)
MSKNRRWRHGGSVNTYTEEDFEHVGDCFRCGRPGHFIRDCFARTDINGDIITGQPIPRTVQGRRGRPKVETRRTTPVGGIYVLQLEHGSYYVGKSEDIRARVQSHYDGTAGCAWTSQFPPVSPIPPTTPWLPDFESWERAETLSLMKDYGHNRVRGWKYTMPELDSDSIESLYNDIVERFDLCRKCGRSSHMVSKCYASSEASWISSFRRGHPFSF